MYKFIAAVQISYRIVNNFAKTIFYEAFLHFLVYEALLHFLVIENDVIT
jgi:hypothetical protein